MVAFETTEVLVACGHGVGLGVGLAEPVGVAVGEAGGPLQTEMEFIWKPEIGPVPGHVPWTYWPYALKLPGVHPEEPPQLIIREAETNVSTAPIINHLTRRNIEL